MAMGPLDDVDVSTLLELVVKFYGAQRSGAGSELAAREASCHLNDGESIMADLSGGWYDAGDHVKVTLSIAYASYVMLKAYDAFPEAFADRDSQDYTGAPNGVPDVLDEARYATDYLVKAHLSETVLVGMVGNAQNDHRQWVTCLEQEALPVMQGGRPRPVSPQANADIAGITSAALALMARLYRRVRPGARRHLPGARAVDLCRSARTTRWARTPACTARTATTGSTRCWRAPPSCIGSRTTPRI